MFGLCPTLFGTMASLSSNPIGISREFHLNLRAGVLARGGEAKVDGEECECGWSAMATATTSFLEPDT